MKIIRGGSRSGKSYVKGNEKRVKTLEERVKELEEFVEIQIKINSSAAKILQEIKKIKEK